MTIERPITLEVCQQLDARIRELESLLLRAHGFVAFGPSSEIARQSMLDAIAKAPNWRTILVDKLVAEIVAWGDATRDCALAEPTSEASPNLACPQAREDLEDVVSGLEAGWGKP